MADSSDHSSSSSCGAAPSPSVEVFAVYGVEPEVQAYAMAKYSRSALSMKESLKEITQQKAEKFLNTFYFQYGHRSIADLAHIALAIERLSILAAIEVADEQRWDGQERSTRYQDFNKSGYYTPDFGADEGATRLYRETIESLFAQYKKSSETMFRHLAEITPKPTELKQEAYDRTLRARAFDITRYLLPLATNTILRNPEVYYGKQITVSAGVDHMLSKIAFVVDQWKMTGPDVLQDLVAQIRAVDPELGKRAADDLLREVRVAPTLVKYADPNLYEIETRIELRQAAHELMRAAPIQPAKIVDLLDDVPLEL